MSMTTDKAAELRKPFPKSAIGKLPKGGTMLDYVGHAATTDRLLAVDPAWSWEPFAVDDRGLPALDSRGNLWIRLTVCGVTRIGVGDGKSAKEVIGDAIRNAAMRFGVALDLWSKEELEGGHGGAPADVPPPRSAQRYEPAQPGAGGAPVSEKQVKLIGVLMGKLHIKDRDLALQYVADVTGRTVTTRNELSAREASKVIGALQADLGETPAPVAPEPPEDAA